MTRWLFHVLRAGDLAWGTDDRYHPPSLGGEGFLHASYRPKVLESARLYFPPGDELVVLAIDPRLLDVRVEVVSTPRGEMPHIHGSIPRDAVTVLPLAEVEAHPDVIPAT